MDNFELDSRLAKDCIVTGKLGNSLLLLMNNALVPWFILVPKTSVTEIVDLSLSEQANLLEDINLLSNFVKVNFEISKLNIAAIGNIVRQLHIHVIGRDPSDYCWPDVVWGNKECESYTDLQIKGIVLNLSGQLGNKFTGETLTVP